MENDGRPEYGPITHFFERASNVLRQASLANILFGIEAEKRGLFKGPVESRAFDIWRSRKVDYYILAWLAIETVIAFLIPTASGWLLALLLVPIVYRIIDILQAAVNMNLFAHLRRDPGQYNITSATRALVLTLWTYVEIAFCFGIVYSSSVMPLQGAQTWWDAYYFSATTQLTISFGDVNPVGATRFIAPVQGMAGFLLAILAIGKLVGLLPRPSAVVGDAADD